MGWFKKTYESAEHIDFGISVVDRVLGYFGVRSIWQIIVTVVIALFSSFVAWLSELKGIEVFIIGLVAFVALLALFKMLAAFQVNKKPAEKVATENKNIVYNQTADTIINITMVHKNVDFADTAERIRDSLRPGLGISPNPVVAKAIINPAKMELLDSSAVESIIRSTEKDFKVQFKWPLPNARMTTNAQVQAYMVAVDSLSAAFTVLDTPLPLRMEMQFTSDPKDAIAEAVQGKPIAWMTPNVAFTKYVPDELKTFWAEKVHEEQQCVLELEEADRIGKEIQLKYGSRGIRMQQKHNQRIAALRNRLAKTQIAKEFAVKQVSEFLEKMLSDNQLVAKGIQPGTMGVEQNIPAFQWRILKLDIKTAQATAENLDYVGVCISKPE